MEDIVVFDEFHEKAIRIQDMNNYLDGYPLDLPCRYANKQACYTKVYIISNVDLKKMYNDIRRNERAVYDAFIRRIHKVIRFNTDGTRNEYKTAAYINNIFDEIDEKVDINDTPFGVKKE